MDSLVAGLETIGHICRELTTYANYRELKLHLHLAVRTKQKVYCVCQGPRSTSRIATELTEIFAIMNLIDRTLEKVPVH